MKSLEEFKNDESGLIMEWIVALFGLLIMIVTYSWFMPFSNVLIGIFIENGAPVAQMMWIRTMSIWGFYIFGILCLLYPFIASYRKNYGQQVGGWQ